MFTHWVLLDLGHVENLYWRKSPVVSKIAAIFPPVVRAMRIHAFHHLYQYRLERSTKPFLARGGKIKRCLYCLVELTHCLCAHQPDIESQVAVLLIVSENEVFKPSNTGRLIADTVKETYVYQWSRTEPNPEMLALLSNPAYYPVLIFPRKRKRTKLAC